MLFSIAFSSLQYSSLEYGEEKAMIFIIFDSEKISICMLFRQWLLNELNTIFNQFILHFACMESTANGFRLDRARQMVKTPKVE